MPEYEAIYTENPVKSLWNWLGSISSIEVARRILEKHPASQPLTDAETVERAKGLTFAIRSAREYFHASPETNLTESCLAYYYGILNLFEALVIASPDPPHTLGEIEASTRQGHGVHNLSVPGVEFPASEVVFFRRQGFIGLYGAMRSLQIDQLAPEKRISRIDQFERPEMALNLKDLLLRVPELRISTRQLWPNEARCLFVFHEVMIRERDNDANLSVEAILRVLPEVRGEWVVDRGFDASHESRLFSISPPAPEAKSIPKASRGILSHDYQIEPIAGKRDILLVHFLILYLLSIFVRYRPDLWRRIVETDLDYLKPVVAEYLQIVERVVPHLVLNELYGIEFFFQQLTRFI